MSPERYQSIRTVGYQKIHDQPNTIPRLKPLQSIRPSSRSLIFEFQCPQRGMVTPTRFLAANQCFAVKTRASLRLRHEDRQCRWHKRRSHWTIPFHLTIAVHSIFSVRLNRKRTDLMKLDAAQSDV